jgi:hypothetical protein
MMVRRHVIRLVNLQLAQLKKHSRLALLHHPSLRDRTYTVGV